MKNILFAFLITALGFSYSAKAVTTHTDGVFGSLTYSEFDGDNVKWKKATGFGAGWARYYKFDQFWFRTGMGLVSKNSKIDSGANNGNQVYVQFLEVPLTVLYKFTPMFGAFGGFNMNLQFMNNYVADYKPFMASLVLGAHFAFEGHHLIEPYLEFGLSKIGKLSNENTDLDQSWGVRYVYLF